MNYLLVCVEVKLAVIELDHNLWVTAVHGPLDSGVDLQVQSLDVLVKHYKLIELRCKLGLTVAVILWTPFIDLAKTHLIYGFLYLSLVLLHLLSPLLLGFAHNEAYFGQDKCQLQLVVFEENQHVLHLFTEKAL